MLDFLKRIFRAIKEFFFGKPEVVETPAKKAPVKAAPKKATKAALKKDNR